MAEASGSKLFVKSLTKNFMVNKNPRRKRRGIKPKLRNKIEKRKFNPYSVCQTFQKFGPRQGDFNFELFFR